MNNLIDELTNANKISHIYLPTEIILNLVLSFISGINGVLFIRKLIKA